MIGQMADQRSQAGNHQDFEGHGRLAATPASKE
jgi:hypothetical protein